MKYSTDDVLGVLFSVASVLVLIDFFYIILSGSWPLDLGDLLGKATYLVISLYVGAGIVNRLLSNARKEQWDDVRVMTYLSILYHISYITSLTSITMAQIEKSHLDLLQREEAIITRDSIRSGCPSENAGASILYLAMLLRLAIQERNKQLDGAEPWYVDAALMRNYYEVVSWRMDDIKNILIPRILMSSNNKKVNDALIRFEFLLTKYEDEMRYRMRLWDNSDESEYDRDAMRHPNTLAMLVEAAGYVYGAIYDDFDPDERITGIYGDAQHDEENLGTDGDTTDTVDTENPNGIQTQV